MKKNYVKPDVFVVEIKQKCSLLITSPNGQDGRSLPVYDNDPQKEIVDENIIM